MSQPDSIIGATIGKYQLVEFLGEGALAKVYKAYHPDLKRYAAMKILHPQLLKDPEFVTNFQQEAQRSAHLKHPNIVQIYDASIAQKFPYFVMEFIQGRSLYHFIQEYKHSKTRIPITTSLRIVYSVGLALAYAHSKQLIHRDVKPSNILLEQSGRVVLTDFGLARLTGQPDLHPEALPVGTPAYAAPEQALGQPPEPRSDLYSLGIVFYELLTGIQPNIASNSLNTTIKHLTHDIPSPIEYFPELPDEIAAIVVRATRRNLNKRYPSLTEFLNDLTKIRIKTKTAKLPSASLKDLRVSDHEGSSWALPDRNEGEEGPVVSLHFVDTGQVIDLQQNREYLIGRKHKSQPILPDIDLTPFNAYEWGISRLHASLAVYPDQITITDIGSSNGTWHAGKRIPKDTPYTLQHGDLLHLGKLKIQILSYE
ncbi:MAG: protein kinase [Anaerolineales bacterium]|nr:protein kinase [Anaerolineales bacterium]